MSAFLVSQECMQRAIAGVDQISRAWMGEYQVEGFGSVASDTDFSKLGALFFKMNDEALAARYDEEPSNQFFRFKPMAMNGSGGTLSARCSELKALQCLRYQCSEGDVPQSALYRGLEKTIGDLATSIIDDLPEYKRAEWG